jgi:hypothetical protein
MFTLCRKKCQKKGVGPATGAHHRRWAPDCVHWTSPLFPARTSIVVLVIVVATLATGARGAAAPRIDVELGTAEGFPATSSQRWFQLLTELKVDNLRIRGARAGEKPAIEKTGSDADPTYKVVGTLTARDELQLPGGKFSSRDRGRLAAWFEKLRTEGPERAAGGPRLPFDLSQQQLTSIGEDLARPVEFSTKDMKLADLLTRVGQGLKFALSADASAAARLRDAQPLQTELKGLARGTALAFALEQEGLALVPKLDSRRQVAYTVSAQRGGQEAWPAGRPLKLPKRDVLPGLFEFLNVELQDVPTSQALAAVAERLNVPVLLDRRALAHYKIDMASTKITLPAKRTTYDNTLRKLMTAAKLKDQWREDDAGKPLLWITTPKPVPGGP